MTIEEALRNLILGDATVADLIGSRLYPTQAPADAAFPFAVYQQADRKTVMTYTGPKLTNNYTLDLSCWGKTYASAKATAKAIRDRLNGYSGVPSGVTVMGIFDETESDDQETPTHGDERGLFAVSMTLSLWYRAAA